MSSLILASIGIIVTIYFKTLTNTIYGGDAGDLVSAILTHGFAHPPGYSLYTLLGILANALPIQFLSTAGRVTIISITATMISLFIFVKITLELFPKHAHSKLILVYSIGVLAFNYIIWLYAVVPEVFPLNTLFVLLIYYFAVGYYEKKQLIFLYVLAFTTGLAFSHHHTFILVFPAVMYLLLKSKGIQKLHLKHILFILVAFIVGLMPNIQLILAVKQNARVVWGTANSLRDIASIFFREGYGTFTAGTFVTQLPVHRLIQLKNLFLYTFNDFTPFGFLAIIIAFLTYLRGADTKKKVLMTSLIINIIFFGPVFFFYANFPLSADFSFATLERFLHAFYFFYAMMIYGGITFIYRFSYEQIKRIQNTALSRVTKIAFLLVLIIYPFGQYLRNYRSIFALKNIFITENLGNDIVMNAQSQSIILLAGDTQLFNSQYVYYNNPRLQRDKIIIHASKLSTQYYPQNLSRQYPQLNLEGISKTTNRINYLIKKNKEKFSIYASDQYSLDLTDYTWVPYGILYKLEKKTTNNPEITKKSIQKFWDTSLNKNLTQKVKMKDPIFNNLFMRDILRVYSIAHQNTAFYYLQQKDFGEAYTHIQSSLILQPTDLDNLYLLSKYYELGSDCNAALNSINKALTQSIDKLFLSQLADIETNCFRDTAGKEIARKLRLSYEQKMKRSLQSF
ncbi:DUF2723 domain-containing protein [Candidatus Roizmanbacteria bacterium]|nr:DUF2723 domain-containing protein [Candidatus Roizmanbacteria bacterium]